MKRTPILIGAKCRIVIRIEEWLALQLAWRRLYRELCNLGQALRGEAQEDGSD